jgi:hypothetical protein
MIWRTFGRVGNVLEYNVTSLTNGREYKIRVAAVNAFGVGAYAESANSVIPGRVPNAPSAVTVTSETINPANNKGSITLSWTTPNTYGSDVTGSSIYYFPTNGQNATVDGASGNTITLTDALDITKSYNYQVRTKSTVGPGQWSTLFTRPPLLPPPSALSVTATASAGYVTLAYSVGNGASVSIADVVSNTGLRFANQEIDLANKTIKIGFGSNAFGSMSFTVTATNLGGSASAASNAVATVGGGGISTAPVLGASQFYEGMLVQEAALPSTGSGQLTTTSSDTLQYQYSTDNGSSWNTIDAVALGPRSSTPVIGGGMFLPSSSSSRHRVRHFISPRPAGSFLLRARGSTSGGVAAAGTPWSGATSITVPATETDPLASQYASSVFPLPSDWPTSFDTTSTIDWWQKLDFASASTPLQLIRPRAYSGGQRSISGDVIATTGTTQAEGWMLLSSVATNNTITLTWMSDIILFEASSGSSNVSASYRKSTCTIDASSLGSSWCHIAVELFNPFYFQFMGVYPLMVVRVNGSLLSSSLVTTVVRLDPSAPRNYATARNWAITDSTIGAFSIGAIGSGLSGSVDGSRIASVRAIRTSRYSHQLSASAIASSDAAPPVPPAGLT